MLLQPKLKRVLSTILVNRFGYIIRLLIITILELVAPLEVEKYKEMPRITTIATTLLYEWSDENNVREYFVFLNTLVCSIQITIIAYDEINSSVRFSVIIKVLTISVSCFTLVYELVLSADMYIRRYGSKVLFDIYNAMLSVCQEEQLINLPTTINKDDL